MLAISLLQPWATLVVMGWKTNETRSWLTHVRGALAFHASKGKNNKIRSLCETDEHISAALAALGLTYDTLPRGGIIGLAQVRDVACIGGPGFLRPALPPNVLDLDPATLSARERAFGDYSPGRFAWKLDAPRARQEMLPCVGRQQLWTLPDYIRDQVYVGLEPSIVQCP